MGTRLKLPTKKSRPKPKLQDYSVLIYGREKIGKTSMCSHFPETCFLMCEPGGKALSLYQVPVTNWEELRGYVELLAKDKKYQTIVIDTADLAYKYCLEHVCEEMGMDHPSDESHGKGWNMVSDEFHKLMARAQSVGKGVVFLSHEKDKELTKANGGTQTRVEPTMTGSAQKTLLPMMDVIGYYHYDDSDKRILRIRGTEMYTAGCRLEDHFVDVDIIPMGSSSKEAYDNFVAAFNNEKPWEKGKKKRTVTDDLEEVERKLTRREGRTRRNTSKKKASGLRKPPLRKPKRL